MRFEFSGNPDLVDPTDPFVRKVYLTGDVSDKSNVPPFVNMFVGIFVIQMLFEDKVGSALVLAPIPGQLNVPFGKFVKNPKLYNLGIISDT